MIPYLVTIILSSMFFFFYNIQKKKTFFSYFFLVISLAIVSIFAGVRGSYVGIDIQVYGNRVFSEATNATSMFSYFSHLKGTPFDVEKGYLVFNYFVSEISSNFNMFYGILNLFTVIIFVIGLLLIKEDIDISLAYTFYLFTIWPLSLNILRQSIAISFVFLVVCLFLKKKYFLSFLSILIGCLFHSTSIVALFIVFLIFFLDKFKRYKYILSFLILLFFPISLFFLIRFIQSSSSDYSTYLGVYGGFAGGFRSLFKCIIPLLLVLPLQSKKIPQKNYSLLILYLIFLELSFFYSFNYIVFGRISYFFRFIMFLYPLSQITKFRNNNTIIMIKILLLVFLILFFWSDFYNTNYGNLFPYTSDLINFFGGV